MHPGHRGDLRMNQPCHGLATQDCVFGVLDGSAAPGHSMELPQAAGMPFSPRGPRHPSPRRHASPRGMRPPSPRGARPPSPRGMRHPSPRGARHPAETTVATVVGLGNEQSMPPMPPRPDMLFGPGSRANTCTAGGQANMLHGASAPSAGPHAAPDAAAAPTGLPRPGIAPHEAKQRAAWDVGSIVEIYSSSAGCWHVSHVTKVERSTGPDVLTMQFYVHDEVKNKALYRTDPQLAPFGSRTSGQLPTGFEVKPSQSRAGQFVCFDSRSGVKYESP